MALLHKAILFKKNNWFVIDEGLFFMPEVYEDGYCVSME